ncbi:hypothetical protein [Kordiimonas sp.]|uniref:hypothetical protein n=1 Tax=Kordiimonas sp. TaxID=1970157 RepID=UPI003A931B6D
MVLDPGVCSGLILRAMNRLKHTICLVLFLFAFMGQGVASAADRMACCERGLMVADTSMSMEMPCHESAADNDITVDTCCKDMATGPVISDLAADISLPALTADRVEVADGRVTPGRTPEYIPPPPNA